MRRVGLEPVDVMEIVQHDQTGGEGFQELPKPTGKAPYRVTSADLEIPASAGMGRSFHVIGDTGGVKDPNPQINVAKAMVADLASHPKVAFAYHVGDIDYFEGAEAEYVPQFFEAYASYLRHIVGIPGNHDGAGGDELASFMRYLCATKPELLPEVAEYNRDTMTQPGPYWTLEDPALTIIGLYSNVPSGGEIQKEQQEWLVAELEAAAEGKPLIVALHHPPYSGDAHHGGSAKMGEVLDQAFDAAKRCPHVVLSGHVHNYQRFTRTAWGKDIAYIVCGAGGYHNLHGMATSAAPGLQVTSDTVLDAYADQVYGFLRLAVESEDGVDNVLQGEYVGVNKEGNVASGIDSFTLTV